MKVKPIITIYKSKDEFEKCEGFQVFTASHLIAYQLNKHSYMIKKSRNLPIKNGTIVSEEVFSSIIGEIYKIYK